MSKPILELQNSSKWSQLWDYSTTAAPVPDKPGYTLEIPTIVLPFQLENHIIAISAKSSTAPSSWKLGGRVAKKIQTGITIGGVPDVTISDARKLWLNQINLFRFTPYTANYALEITPAYYLTQISLEVWVYTGIDTDTVTNQLNRIEFAVDEINLQ
jgi:hypothetical protein